VNFIKTIQNLKEVTKEEIISGNDIVGGVPAREISNR